MAPRSPAPEAVQRLRDALNDLYLDRGKPDLRQLEEVVEMQQRHRTISRTTIGKILKCDPCPSKEQVLAVSGRSAATWPGFTGSGTTSTELVSRLSFRSSPYSGDNALGA
jgi:hypothetical protein